MKTLYYFLGIVIVYVVFVQAMPLTPLQQLVEIMNLYRNLDGLPQLKWVDDLNYTNTTSYAVQSTHVPQIDICMIAVNTWYNEGINGSNYTQMMTPNARWIACKIANYLDNTTLLCAFD